MVSTSLPTWYTGVKHAFSGVPAAVWLCILLPESGGNPSAYNGPDNNLWGGNHSDLEESVGLLQLNRKGGQGAGYTVQALLDPVFNASIGAQNILPAYRAAVQVAAAAQQRDIDIALIAATSGHPTHAGLKPLIGEGSPGQVSRSDSRILRIQGIYESIRAAERAANPMVLEPLEDAQVWAAAADAYNSNAKGSGRDTGGAPGSGLGDGVKAIGDDIGDAAKSAADAAAKAAADALVTGVAKLVQEHGLTLALAVVAVLFIAGAVLSVAFGPKAQTVAAAVTGGS